MKVLFGIDIGGTNIKIGLFSLDEKLLFKTSIKTNSNSTVDNIFSDIKDATKKILTKLNYQEQGVIGYGFGLPGPIKNNVVARLPNLGWGKTDLKKYFAKYFKYGQMTSGNDAQVAAYGEYKALDKEGDLVFITLGTGVGGGIIINDKIIEGAHGAGAEVGHIQVEYQNPVVCSCGLSGCLETVAGIGGFKEVGLNLIKDFKGFTNLTENTLTPIEIFKQYEKEDLLAIEIVDKVTDYIGHACAKIAVVVDPSTIIIGGGISNAGKPLIDGINKAYQKHSHFGTKDTNIILASLSGDAGIYGAYYLIKDKLIEEGVI